MRLGVHQRGYLLIVALVLVIIVSFIGVILSHMFTSSTQSTGNILQSKRALYIATSAIEIAKRDITENDLRCFDINGTAKYTNASLLGGKVTVTGTENVALTTLYSAISTTGTIIHLTDATNFAEKGVVRVGDEVIGYFGKNGNTLIGATRGELDSPITSHYAGKNLVQNQCVLTATAGTPNLTSPQGKRTIKQVLLGESLSLGPHRSVITSPNQIKVAGTTEINNPGQTIGGVGMGGCAIVGGAGIDFQGSATTQLNDGTGNLILCSTKDNLREDVVSNYSEITPTNLFSYYFTEPKSEVKAAADQTYTVANIDGVTDKTIWVNGNMKFTAAKTYDIGSATDPVILIVDGDFELVGAVQVNFYGFLYTTGTIKTAGGGRFIGLGAMAAEGEIDLTGDNSKTLDPVILDLLGMLNPKVKVHYVPISVSFFEPFH